VTCVTSRAQRAGGGRGRYRDIVCMPPAAHGARHHLQRQTRALQACHRRSRLSTTLARLSTLIETHAHRHMLIQPYLPRGRWAKEAEQARTQGGAEQCRHGAEVVQHCFCGLSWWKDRMQNGQAPRPVLLFKVKRVPAGRRVGGQRRREARARYRGATARCCRARAMPSRGCARVRAVQCMGILRRRCGLRRMLGRHVRLPGPDRQQRALRARRRVHARQQVPEVRGAFQASAEAGWRTSPAGFCHACLRLCLRLRLWPIVSIHGRMPAPGAGAGASARRARR